MTQSEYIIQRFGGIHPLARQLGRSPSSIQRWKESGTIPARHYSVLLDAGMHLSPPLQAREFAEALNGERHIMQGEAA